MSTDVLGRVVEAASGVPLADFVQQHVLDPLGMGDTMWHVPPTRPTAWPRCTSRRPVRARRSATTSWAPTRRQRPTATMGGGGLCGSAGDYVRFAEMLRGRGELDGVRILAPGTVDLMASNHLPGGADLTAFGRPLFSETTFDGVGFGLGVSVTIDPVAAKVPGSVGDFGWGGAASTAFWVDPVRDLTVVFMTQLLPSSTLPLRSQLKQLVHAAVVGA